MHFFFFFFLVFSYIFFYFGVFHRKHTQSSNIHPLAHILHTSALILSSCPFFTVYPNRIMRRHPTPLQVKTTRAREGGPKEHRGKQKWPRETHSFTYAPGLSTLSYLRAHCRAASTVIPLLPKATFTLSIQPNLGLPRTRPPRTSAINNLLAIQHSSILSKCPNYINTL